MNVLLTCAGRRNYLIGYFREALGRCGKVFAADTQETAPALAEADQAFIVPRVDHKDYIPTLVQISKDHDVRLIIPLNDLELPVLARHRAIFIREGIFPVVPSEETVNTCLDKVRTYEFLSSCGLPVPPTYNTLREARRAIRDGEVGFPLIVKPRWGAASFGIESAEDEEELNLVYRLVRRKLTSSAIGATSSADVEQSVLIQRYLIGDEYGLDVINDLHGNYVTTFVKRKLGMRAGETDRAVTVCNPCLERLGKALGQRLRHVGNLDVDVVVEGDTAYVLDMNPRFGGGYPFSHVAGANLPAALIAWATGGEANPAWLKVRSDVVAAKCDRLVTFQKAPS